MGSTMWMLYGKPVLWMLLAAPVTMLAQPADTDADDCIGGELDAPVRIELFSDYQCPACRGFFLDAIQKVMETYGAQNKVCVIYHDFPLKGHVLSRSATQYSKAAQRLGRKQWLAVIRALYTSQAEWSWDGSVETVVSRALDPRDFTELKKLLQDKSIDAAVERAVALADKREVTSTPTFFLHSGARAERVVGSVPYRVLKAYIDRLIQ